MRMPDVNLLVYAHRGDSTEHARYADWLWKLASSREPFALSVPVMQGFVRIVTQPKLFAPPSTLAEAFEFLDGLVDRPNSVVIQPGAQAFHLFREICTHGRARGKLVSDAAHAALAIEHGCVWCTADTDFARFAPMLRWEHV
jgi:toxin-antitoxin system PIN domain toxin